MSDWLTRHGKMLFRSMTGLVLVLLVLAAMPATSASATPAVPPQAVTASSAVIAPRGTATTATVTNNASLVINKPSGVVSGDVLIANLVQVHSITPPTAPAGWTLIDQRVLADPTKSFAAVFYKVAGGSEGTSYTFTVPTGGSVTVAGAIVAFSGANSTNPFDVPPGTIQVNNTSATATAASITTATPDAIIVMLGQAGGTNPTWSGWNTTSPGALNEILNFQSTGTTIGAAWATKSTPGPTGNGTATLSTVEQNGAILLALRPKTDPTLSILNSPVTYNGSPQAANVNPSVPGAVSNVQYNGVATAPTDAGTYAVTADFVPTDTGAYNSLSGASAGNFVIDKATPTISVTNSPVTYNGSPQAANVTGSVGGTVSNVQYNGVATDPTDAGTYAVTANFTPTDTTNYNGLVVASAGNFVIDKATPTLSVTNSPVIYNGSPQAATVTGSVGGTVSNVQYNGVATDPTDVGTYAVTANFTPTDTTNYNSLTSASAGNFVIDKADQTITVTTHAPANAINGSSFTVAATGGGSGNAVTFNAVGVCTNVGATFTMTSSTGTCTVQYDQAGNANYNAAPQVTETVNAVDKLTPTLSVTNSPVTYTGSPQAATVAGSVAGTVSNVQYNGLSTVPTNAGTYAVTADFTPTDTTTYNSLTAASAGSFIINKANQTITVTTHAPASATNGSSFTVAATGGGSGNPVTYTAAGGCTNAGATFTMTSGTSACTVQYNQAGNANYNAAPQVTEQVSAINPIQKLFLPMLRR